MQRRLFILLIAFALSFAGCDKQQAQKTDAPAEEVADTQMVGAPTAPEAEPDTQPSDEPTEQPTAPLIERSLLWKVEGPNGPLYLFGTIHGGIDGLSWEAFPAPARQALDASKVVVLEANLADVNQKELAKTMMLPGGKSLEKMLGEEAFDDLAEATGQMSVILDRLQPWAAYSELSRKMIGGGEAVDKMVEESARAQSKELVYLEGVEEQIGLLQKAVDAELLRYMVETREDQKKLLDELIAAYQAGDADKLAKVAFDPREMERHPKMYEVLFDRRNKAWVGELEKLVERGDVFVAVGAGHLVGDNSVIAMLEKKGHEVERVSAADSTESDDAK